MTVPVLPKSVQRELGPTLPENIKLLPQDVYEHVYLSKADAIIEGWRVQTEQDRALRKTWSRGILLILGGQTLGFFAIVVMLGVGWIQLSDDVVRVLVVSVMSEIFGMAFVVVRYLFNKTDVSLLEQLSRENNGT